MTSSPFLQPLDAAPDAPDADDYRYQPYTLAQAREAAQLAGEGLSTGFPKLDAEDFRLRPGKLYVIAGRPSEGKTAMLLEICMRTATERPRETLGPSIFVSYEENLHHIYLRLLLRGVGRENMTRTGLLDLPPRTFSEAWLRGATVITSASVQKWSDDLQRAADQIDALGHAGRLVLVDGDADGGEIDSLTRWLRRAAEFSEQSPGVVVVDYYQKIRAPLYMRGASRQEQLQEVADLLRRYAKGERLPDPHDRTGQTGAPADPRHAVPVLVGAQVNRESVEKNGVSVQPELHHIREADDLANDAAGVLTLHRPSDEVLNAKLAKNRDGKRGSTVTLGFFGAAGLVTDTATPMGNNTSWGQ